MKDGEAYANGNVNEQLPPKRQKPLLDMSRSLLIKECRAMSYTNTEPGFQQSARGDYRAQVQREGAHEWRVLGIESKVTCFESSTVLPFHR